jgi:aminotransferase in exopolysaccharide biosynthesis
MFDTLINGVRALFDGPEGLIPLHAPWFDEEDERAVADVVRTTFVSSVGPDITAFEEEMARRTGAAHCVAVVNGTSALHMALLLSGCRKGDLVITQAFSFIATANAIAYTGAEPVFIDIDRATLGLSPSALRNWLERACRKVDGGCRHIASGRTVRACVPMHTFGLVMDAKGLLDVCTEWGIAVVEDAAEALGSTMEGRHAGTFAPIGTLSFNGNKIITCGGGGAMLFADKEQARLAKHLTTQAKVPHPWAFTHDALGYNYRLPNLNAALLRSQLRKLEHNIATKRALHDRYARLFADTPWQLMEEPLGTRSNYWLNAVIMRDRQERDAFLQACADGGIQARPAWDLCHEQPMHAHAMHDGLSVSRHVQERLVNLPSSAHPPRK